MSLGLTYKSLGSPLRLWTLVRVTGAGVAIGVISVLIPAAGFWLIVKLGVLGVVYLGLLWATGELTVQDAKPFALWKTERP